MYSTCIFCESSLGRNETVAHFPVGRRLAFDAAKGRLWVVCPRCERWNLTPLEDRWEAIEECERRYRDARKRAATDQVGLARVDDGVDLIRIGAPLRPEFAAWRYGRLLARRRTWQLAATGAGLVGAGVVAAANMVSIFTVGYWFGGVDDAASAAVNGSPETVLARLRVEGSTLTVRRRHLAGLRFVWAGPGHARDAWRLRVEHADGTTDVADARAMAVAQRLLPAVNRFGASRSAVRDAVGAIEQVGDPDGFVHSVARSTRRAWPDLPASTRLALEMALHEETERRALAGELSALEARWRDAEEIAAIADGLLVPDGVAQRVARLGRSRRE